MPGKRSASQVCQPVYFAVVQSIVCAHAFCSHASSFRRHECVWFYASSVLRARLLVLPFFLPVPVPCYAVFALNSPRACVCVMVSFRRCPVPWFPVLTLQKKRSAVRKELSCLVHGHHLCILCVAHAFLR
ncbi:hypothetical protein TRVL_10277 [Trypanosoma vivax]|nr:hypothetical protein TRVL_10277 [Trypanosoma vivax]